jgi:hypothetical protein
MSLGQVELRWLKRLDEKMREKLEYDGSLPGSPLFGVSLL